MRASAPLKLARKFSFIVAAAALASLGACSQLGSASSGNENAAGQRGQVASATASPVDGVLKTQMPVEDPLLGRPLPYFGENPFSFAEAQQDIRLGYRLQQSCAEGCDINKVNEAMRNAVIEEGGDSVIGHPRNYLNESENLAFSLKVTQRRTVQAFEETLRRRFNTLKVSYYLEPLNPSRTKFEIILNDKAKALNLRQSYGNESSVASEGIITEILNLIIAKGFIKPDENSTGFHNIVMFDEASEFAKKYLKYPVERDGRNIDLITLPMFTLGQVKETDIVFIPTFENNLCLDSEVIAFKRDLQFSNKLSAWLFDKPVETSLSGEFTACFGRMENTVIILRPTLRAVHIIKPQKPY